MAAQVQQGEISTSGSRLVWVLNRDVQHDYLGTCGGTKVRIPKDREKIAKPFTSGGNLFPYLDAVQFVRDLKEPQGFVLDNHGKQQPVFRTKELYEQELSPEEFKTIVGKKPDDLKKEALREEKKARRTLNSELSRIPNKVEVKDEDE
jgi:hypothetical protein